MASKTIDHMNLYVAVAEYQHENAPDQTFNCLRVYVSYRKGRGFIVGYHPGWGDARWWGCLLDVGDTNPLTGGLEALVKEATKNNAKLLQSMYDGLKQAQEHIAYLFNERDWQHLRHVMTMAAQGYNMDMFMRDLKHEAMVKQQVENGRKASGPKFRPATLEEIDGRDVDLYMNGERVYVLMVCRSETIETGESKLDYITLTNMKKVQVEDLYVIDNDNNEPNKEDQTMKLNLSNNKNESGNVQNNAQVNNNASEPIVKQVDVMGLMGALNRDGHAKLSDHVIEDAEAVEVKDEQAEEIESVNVGEVTLATIMPKMQAEPEPTKQEVSSSKFQVSSEPVNTGRTKFVVAGVPKPGETGDKAGKPQVSSSKVQGSSKPTAKPAPETCNVKPETLSKVTLVTYTTKRGETAPRIIGFSGEDDPRWKPIHDEKQALIAAYNKAKKKDPKAKMTSSPFGPAWLTDREGNGEKTYCMTFGVKYMDVAKALCAAYNTNDRDQWAKAEQAVRDTKAGIAAGYQAEREARKAARQQVQGSTVQGSSEPAAPAMSNEEQAMFELFKKFLKGDKAAMAQVNEVLKAA